jgi:hypothetical protein
VPFISLQLVTVFYVTRKNKTEILQIHLIGITHLQPQISVFHKIWLGWSIGGGCGKDYFDKSVQKAILHLVQQRRALNVCFKQKWKFTPDNMITVNTRMSLEQEIANEHVRLVM